MTKKISKVAEDWRKDAETKELPLKNGETYDIYVLEKIDWAEIDKKIGKDVWKMLLNIYDSFSDMSKEEYDKLSDEKKEKAAQQSGMDFMKELGFGMQLQMFLQSFKKDDPDVTIDDVSKVLAYQVPAHVSEMDYLQFMLGGMTKEEVEEEVDDEIDSKNSEASLITES